jgi:WD40 repeat protein
MLATKNFMQKTSATHTDLHQLVYDGHRFMQYFANTIEEHPLLVYASALPFAPANTKIYEIFYHNRLLKVVSGVEKMWPRLLQLFQGHSNLVSSVTFSPDGSKIVSGSHDKTIRVWDASTGIEMLSPLKGHDDTVFSVAFSPDGSKIVSGSYDKTIRVWDVSTGVKYLSSQQNADINIPMSASDSSQTVSLHGGWFTDIITGHCLGRLPVDNSYYRWKAHGSCYVGWTIDHKPIILQFP